LLNNHEKETFELIPKMAQQIAQDFIKHAVCLLHNTPVGQCHNRELIYGVALENIMKQHLSTKQRRMQEYKRLKGVK